MVTGNILRDTKLTGNQAAGNAQSNSFYTAYARNVLNSATGSFGSVMNLSVQNVSDAGENMARTENSVTKEQLTSADAADNAMRRQSKVEYIVKSANHTGSGQAVDEAVMSDSLKALTSDLKAVVCEVLDLTDEELEKMLAENGMCISDLLMPNNLAAFVADAAADGDMMKLLTDSDVSQLYSELGNRLEELLATAGDSMNLAEDELVNLLNEYAAQQDMQAESFEESIEESISSKPGKTLKNDKAMFDNEKQIPKEQAEIKEELSEQAGRRVRNSQAQPGEEIKQSVTDALEEKIEFQSDSGKHSALSGQEGESLSGQFVENLIKNVDNSLNTSNVFNGYTVDAEDVVRQLIDSIKVNISGQTSEMELQLSPESLGKVNLLVESKNGVITAQLTAQNEAVKSIIENQLVLLKENFQEQGLKVEAIEVMVESHGFETGKNLEGRNNDNSSEGGRKSTRRLTLEEIDARLSEQDSISEEDMLAAEMMRATGGSVDYTA